METVSSNTTEYFSHNQDLTAVQNIIKVVNYCFRARNDEKTISISIGEDPDTVKISYRDKGDRQVNVTKNFNLETADANSTLAFVNNYIRFIDIINEVDKHLSKEYGSLSLAVHYDDDRSLLQVDGYNIDFQISLIQPETTSEIESLYQDLVSKIENNI
jgi:hypothetical protein